MLKIYERTKDPTSGPTHLTGASHIVNSLPRIYAPTFIHTAPMKDDLGKGLSPNPLRYTKSPQLLNMPKIGFKPCPTSPKIDNYLTTLNLKRKTYSKEHAILSRLNSSNEISCLSHLLFFCSLGEQDKLLFGYCVA